MNADTCTSLLLGPAGASDGAVPYDIQHMPDIFIAAYPDTYNRNNKPLYMSCEIEHKDISTLVYVLRYPFLVCKPY
jgi:hypothetical protein